MAGQSRSGVGKFLFGTPAETVNIDRYNPTQQNVINKSAQMASNMLGNASFDPYERQARQNFAQKTIPSLAERFTSMGGQGSSAFGQQLGNAGANLESNLATGRANYDQGLLQQLLGTGLTQQFDSIYRPEQSGFLANTLNSGAKALPYLAMLYATGGLGGAAGGLGALAGGGLTEGDRADNVYNQYLSSMQQQPILPQNFGQNSNQLMNILRNLSGQGNQDNQLANEIYNSGAYQNPNLMNILRALSGPDMSNTINNFPAAQNNQFGSEFGQTRKFTPSSLLF